MGQGEGGLPGEDARPAHPVHPPGEGEWSPVCLHSVGGMSMASVSLGEKKPKDACEAALEISPSRPGVEPNTTRRAVKNDSEK